MVTLATMPKAARKDASLSTVEARRDMSPEIPVSTRTQPEFSSSNKPRELLMKNEEDLSMSSGVEEDASLSPQAIAALRAAMYTICVMAAVGSIVQYVRATTMKRWEGLMEVAGFEHWSQIDGLWIRFVSTCLSLFLSGPAFAFLAWATRDKKWSSLEKQLDFKVLLLFNVMASFLSLLAFGFTWVVSKGISKKMVKRLAKQSVAVANFNRGYCQAWCRQEGVHLAVFTRGECGPDETTVFDEIIDGFTVGDWCQQAIVTQNFDLVGTHDGLSPFAGLLGRGGSSLAQTPVTDVLAIIHGIVGIYLLIKWVKVLMTFPNSLVIANLNTQTTPTPKNAEL